MVYGSLMFQVVSKSGDGTLGNEGVAVLEKSDLE